MRTLIAGSNARLAYHLARQAQAHGHDVVLLLPEAPAATELARQLDVPTAVGRASDPELLRQIEAWRSDVLVAISDEDPVNLVACQIAREMFGVERTVALVHDPDNRKLFERLGVQPVISTAEILGALIEEQTARGGVLARLALRAGELAVFELRLTETSPATRQRLDELRLPDGALVVGIVRDGGPLQVPRGATRLEAGDELFLFCEADVQSATLDALIGLEE